MLANIPKENYTRLDQKFIDKYHPTLKVAEKAAAD